MELKSVTLKNYLQSDGSGGVVRFYDNNGYLIKSQDKHPFVTPVADSDGYIYNDYGNFYSESFGFVHLSVNNASYWTFTTLFSDSCTNNSNYGAYAGRIDLYPDAYIKCTFKEIYNISKIEINLLSVSQNGNYGSSLGCDVVLESNQGKIKTFTIKHESLSNRNEIITLLLDQDGEYDTRKHIYKTNIEGKIITKENHLENIKRLQNIRINCEENPNTKIRFAISVDDKNTWKIYRGNSWITILESDIINNGNTKNEIESLTISEFDALLNNNLSTVDIYTSMITTDENISASISQIDIAVVEN